METTKEIAQDYSLDKIMANLYDLEQDFVHRKKSFSEYWEKNLELRKIAERKHQFMLI